MYCLTKPPAKVLSSSGLYFAAPRSRQLYSGAYRPSRRTIGTERAVARIALTSLAVSTRVPTFARPVTPERSRDTSAFFDVIVRDVTVRLPSVVTRSGAAML